MGPCSAIFLKQKMGSETHSDTKFGRRGGGLLVIPMPGKKNVPERRPGVRASKKEFPERSSGAFRHKSTPRPTSTKWYGRSFQ
jgi:hypothetical protein